VQAILDAAETFEQQCASQMTGCAMQARFLKNVVEKYQSMKSHRTSLGADETVSPQSVPQHGTRDNACHSRTTASNPNTHSQNGGNAPVDSTITVGERAEANMPTESQADFGTDLFADKDMWESLFADAGFWAGERMFFGENSNTI
jgi:hypothetical protein